MSFKFTLGLLVGAAAGAALMHYLNTPEGKAFSQRLKKDVCEAEDRVTGFATDIISKGRSIIQDVEEQVEGRMV